MNEGTEVPTVDDVIAANERAWRRGVGLQSSWLQIESVIGREIHYIVHIRADERAAVIKALNELEAE